MQSSALSDTGPTSHVSRKSPRQVLQLARLERLVLAHLAENQLGTSALEELALGIERIAAAGTLAAVAILDEASGGKLRHGAGPSLPVAYVKHIDGQSIGPSAGSCGTAAYQRATVITEDLSTDPLWERDREAAIRSGLRACWSVPVIASNGEVLGTFAFYYRGARAPGPEDLNTLDAAATLARLVLERQREERARVRELNDLREAVRYRELFASILAHDLRNPLNTLLMGTQVLMESADAHGQQVLTRMQDSGARMARMIEQVLDLTRSRQGEGIALIRGAVCLGDLAASIVSELALAYPDAHLELQVEGDTLGEWDRDRLAQVLSNLIGNAIEHGARADGARADGARTNPEPFHEVVVRVDGRDPAQVLLQTHNLGTIPAEALPSLFDPFKPARAGAKRTRGLGLGLFITRLIVTAHGGAISAASDAGGTRFQVRLPRAASSEAITPVAPLRSVRQARLRGVPGC
jgi:signal transduction histidine kinase